MRLFEILFNLLSPGCRHSNYSKPMTIEETHPETGAKEKQCGITCLDCGAEALFDPLKWERVGPWMKPIPVQKEIKPHVYRTA